MNPKVIQVLNAGYVRLVDSMGSDLSIARSARVSYAAEPRTEVDPSTGISPDSKLIHYLLKNKHTSPFESVTFTFEIALPIFVCRQWHRHRTWSYNEVSARYTELPEVFYDPELSTITTQHSSNKQMRTSEQNPGAQEIYSLMYNTNKNAFESYRSLLAAGCPRELARTVLPMGTYTTMFATVDLHNLLHFIKLRLHEHAQYEIRVYAEALLELVSAIVPETIKHFKEINNV